MPVARIVARSKEHMLSQCPEGFIKWDFPRRRPPHGEYWSRYNDLAEAPTVNNARHGWRGAAQNQELKDSEAESTHQLFPDVQPRKGSSKHVGSR